MTIEDLSEQAKWLRDADSHYIGARRLGLESDAAYVSVYKDSFFTLAHGALERYMKGILTATDPTQYSATNLRMEFRHSLSRLLQEVRDGEDLNVADLDWAVNVLDAEWNHARYLVSAVPDQLIEDAGAFNLSDLDRIVSVVRNRLVDHLSDAEVNESIVVALWRSSFPFDAFRDAFLKGNDSVADFTGLPEQG